MSRASRNARRNADRLVAEQEFANQHAGMWGYVGTCDHQGFEHERRLDDGLCPILCGGCGTTIGTWRVQE